MALPKIKHPTFKLKVPSTGEELTFRPFTVKEEKVLLIAQASEDPAEVLNAVLQVIGNCCVDELDPQSLASFDIDYLFIKLRARSVNNFVEVTYVEPSGEKHLISVDLNDVEIQELPNHSKTIMVDEEIGVIMRYPRADIIKYIKTEDITSVFTYCVETIFDGDSLYKVHDGDVSEEELNEFIESLSPGAVEKIQLFFDTMPCLSHTVQFTRKDGSQGSLVLQSLSDFFKLQ